MFIPLARCASIPHFHYPIGLTQKGLLDAQTTAGILGTGSEFCSTRIRSLSPESVMGEAAKNVSKEVKKQHREFSR